MELLSDWVHIQISLIELQQVEMMEVFLPYVYDGNTDKTLFDKFRDSGYRLLPGKK